MIYTDKEIQNTLDKLELKNIIFFIGLLPSFIWDRSTKKVVEYASNPTPYNDLIVIDTELIELQKDLETYLKDSDINEQDILVFCINTQYFPSDKKKWVRIKIINKGII